MGTKNPLSPGSQFTGKGVVQGTALVSPKDGQPVDVIIDGAGVHRLAVDADLTAESIVVDTRELNFTTDSVEVGDPVTGAHIRVETDGSINANVNTSAFTLTPDSELIVGSEDGTTTGIKHVVKVNPDGSLAVSIATNPGTPINTFNEALSVASNATTTIATYTVSVGKTGYLQRVNVGGTNIATYDVKVNGTTIDRLRTYFGSDLTFESDYTTPPGAGLPYSAGTIITVVVTNFRPTSADFEARIQAVEV